MALGAYNALKLPSPALDFFFIPVSYPRARGDRTENYRVRNFAFGKFPL